MKKISYCGLVCEECPIYIATENNDLDMKKSLAKEYSNSDCILNETDINCCGCKSDNISNIMCGECEIRNCKKNNNFDTCAQCKEYPCNIVNKYVPEDADNRKRLDSLR